MNQEQLIKAINKCPSVFVDCVATSDDVYYYKVTKAEALHHAHRTPDAEFRASVFQDGNLYIG